MECPFLISADKKPILIFVFFPFINLCNFSSIISDRQVDYDIHNIINTNMLTDTTDNSHCHAINHVNVNNEMSFVNLKIMVWNIHGLGDKLNNKEFIDYVSKLDLVIFLETMKLDTYIPILSNFEFRHFQRKFQHPRARRPSGGIGIMVRIGLLEDNIVSVVKKI